MTIIRHRQRAITSKSPVEGQQPWINPNKGQGSPSFGYTVAAMRYTGATPTWQRSVNLAQPPDSTEYSWSLWLTPESNANMFVLAIHAPGGGIIQLRLQAGATDPFFLLRLFETPGGTQRNQGTALTTTLPIGEKHHLYGRGAVGGSMQIFIDGADSTAADPGWVAGGLAYSQADRATLGASDSNASGLDACIADFAFWRDDEGAVAPQLYNGGVEPDPGADGGKLTGTVPIGFFGGRNTAADWQAGKNSGTGTDLSDANSGVVVDCPDWPDFVGP